MGNQILPVHPVKMDVAQALVLDTVKIHISIGFDRDIHTVGLGRLVQAAKGEALVDLRLDSLDVAQQVQITGGSAGRRMNQVLVVDTHALVADD
ncbi:hypothetical protein D3C85_1140260 [compost metagenome]